MTSPTDQSWHLQGFAHISPWSQAAPTIRHPTRPQPSPTLTDRDGPHKHIPLPLPAHPQFTPRTAGKSSYDSRAYNLIRSLFPPLHHSSPFPIVTVFGTLSLDVAQRFPVTGLQTSLIHRLQLCLLEMCHLNAPVLFPVSAYSHSLTSPELFHLNFPQTSQTTRLTKLSTIQPLS